MKTVRALELHFENCESLRLETNVLGCVHLGKISKEISRIGCNCIAEQYFVMEVALEIFAEAEELSSWTECYDPDQFKLRRIEEYNDISCIKVFYEDGTDHVYYINYNAETEMLGAPNVNQISRFSNLGNLYVVISEDRDFEYYFSDEKINDEEYMSFIKTAYDIGAKHEESEEIH